MKFDEFKEVIEQAFMEKFNQSFCKCGIFRCLGKSITIDCMLGRNTEEWINGLNDNDMMSVKFMIHMPDSWNEGDELPEEMVMEALQSAIKTKPEDAIWYCAHKKVAYRKTKGNAEKLVKAFQKYVDRLYTMVIDEYKADNLMDFEKQLVKDKRYAA